MEKVSYELLVEGPDDSNAFYHLLKQHDIALWEKNLRSGIDRKVKIAWIENGGVEALLEGLKTRLKFKDSQRANDRIGIVVDADIHSPGDGEKQKESSYGIARRWQQVRDILVHAGYTDVPETPDPDGTIVGIHQDDRPNIGIWLMPDNKVPGELEHFISFLVPAAEQNVLWQYAGDCLRNMPERSSLPDREQQYVFHPGNTIKAHVHTWLAWQSEPGKPIGQAITKKYLDANAPHARLFLEWIRRLFTDTCSERDT